MKQSAILHLNRHRERTKQRGVWNAEPGTRPLGAYLLNSTLHQILAA